MISQVQNYQSDWFDCFWKELIEVFKLAQEMSHRSASCFIEELTEFLFDLGSIENNLGVHVKFISDQKGLEKLLNVAEFPKYKDMCLEGKI